MLWNSSVTDVLVILLQVSCMRSSWSLQLMIGWKMANTVTYIFNRQTQFHFWKRSQFSYLCSRPRERSKLSAFLQESASDLQITDASKVLRKSSCCILPTFTLYFRNTHLCDNKGGKPFHDLAIRNVSSAPEHRNLHRLKFLGFPSSKPFAF